MSKRWQKGAVAVELLILTLGGLVGLGGIAASRSPAVRQAVLSRVVSEVESRYGIAIAASDFRFNVGEGRLVIDDVRFGRPGAPPVLTARQVVVGLRLKELRATPPRLQSIELDSPVVDLSAPFPELGGGEGDGEEGAGIDIGRFALTGGELRGLTLAEGDPPDARLGVDGARIVGALDGGRLTARLVRSRFALASEVLGARTGSLKGSIAGPVGGPWGFDGVEVVAAGVTARLAGEAGLGDEAPLRIDFDLRGDPAALLPDRALAGNLEATGRVDLRSQEGELRLTARGLPALGVAAFLPETTGLPPLAGVTLDLDADLELGPGSLGLLAGETTAVAWRGGRRLLRLEARPRIESERQVRLPLDLRLLPDGAGERRLTATLLAPTLTELAEGRWEGGRLTLRLPRLAELPGQLETLWPGLAPAGLAAEFERPGPASVALRADFRGPLTAPEGSAAGSVTLSGGRLELAGSGSLGSGRARLTVDAAAFDLAAVGVEGLTGVLDGRVEARRFENGESALDADLTARELVFGAQPPLDRVAVTAAAQGTSLELSSLRVEREGSVVEGSAQLRLASLLTPPLTGGTFDLRLSDPRLREQLATVDGGLTDGTLRMEVALASAGEGGEGGQGGAGGEEEAAAEGGAELRVELPLAVLGSSVETLVAQPATGDVDLGWRLARRDWGELLTRFGLAAPGVLRFGSSGSLLLDPRRPLEAAGTATVEALEVVAEELELAVPEGLALAFGDGRFELARTAIEVAGEVLAVAAVAELEGERLRLVLDPVGPAECAGRVETTLPRDRVRRLLGVAEAVPDESSPPIELALALSACEIGGLVSRLAELGLEDSFELSAGLTGRARVDPDAPAAAEVALAVTGLEGRIKGQSVRQLGPLDLALEEGRLRLGPASLELGGQEMTVAASAELAPGFAGGPLSELVRTLSLTATGGLDAALIEPLLAGGVASGDLALDLDVSGSPDSLGGRLSIEGPEATILYPSPYRTEIASPRVRVELAAGAVRLDGTELTLNEGRVQLFGGFGAGGALDLKAVFSDVRYRLDYGLLVTLGGSLDWRGPAFDDSTLSGSVRLARGTLTRPIELDRNFLVGLLAPVDLSGTASGPLEGVALELEVTTREGVRVRNNLADLLVLWEPLQVRGSLDSPRIEGTLEVQPGGLIYAPGQTLRLERASISYSGRPGEAPELEFSTSTTVDEPEFSRATALSTATDGAPDGESGLGGLGGLSQGLALFYGEQVASRVGEALGGTEVSLRPIPVFGETDPAARLNISRDFTRRISVVASIDLREAEGQTYILDLHDLPYIPSLRSQLFTLDDGTEGGTMTQSLRFGGRGEPTTDPTIRELTIEGRPPGVSRRGLKRALRLEKGDPLGEGDRFAAEVEVEEYLRARGYPSARVEVVATPSRHSDGGVELAIGIEAGIRVGFRFAGEKPPERLRASVRSLYRADLWEEASLEEMREQTVRIFRSRGHLEPEVEITVEPAAPGDEVARWVIVISEPGPKIEPTAPTFEGIEPDESAYVASRFWSPVQRTELALGLPEAERRALAVLGELGYPDASLVGVRFTEENEIVVEVEPGPQQKVSSVEVVGFEGDLVDPELAPGDPARADRIAAGANRLRRELESRGYPDARVWARRAAEPDDRFSVRVDYEVEAGRQFRFGDTEFEGLGATRRRWAKSVAALPSGETFTESQMRSAKRRLYRTGLYSSVGARIERPEEGELADVVFELDERPRYQVSYGLRWDTDDGASLVVDATDGNFAGRGVRFGVRALYSELDSSFRTSVEFPRFLGGRGELRWFNLVRREVDELEPSDLITESLESTLQFDHPLGRHLRGRIYASWLDTRVREEVPDPIFPLDERLQSPVVGAQLLYDRRGAGVLPRRGLFASLDLSGSAEVFGSDFRYLRSFAQAHLYRTLAERGPRALVWAQSFRVGAAEAFDQRLARDRFFAGGPFSVRGYPTESLGPAQTIGGVANPIGGESLLVINQELRMTVLVDRLTTLLFFDAGNVWEELSQTDSTLFTSAGLGFRAITPIGLLRLDLARPLDRRPGDAEYKIHFGFGTLF